jgi:hypothetical protein
MPGRMRDEIILPGGSSARLKAERVQACAVMAGCVVGATSDRRTEDAAITVEALMRMLRTSAVTDAVAFWAL